MRAASPLLLLSTLLLLSACDTLSDTGDAIERTLGYDKESTEVKLEGERETILGQAKELQPDEETQSSPLSLDVLPANAAWPQINATAAGVAGNLAYDGTGAEADSAQIGSGEGFGDGLVSPPAIAAGRVFGMDGDAVVSAQSANGLKRLWRSKALVDRSGSILPGGGVGYGRGRLVAVNGAGKIVALNADDGKKIWEYALNLPVRTPPRLFGTNVLIQTADQQLYAFGLAEGNLLWRHRGVGESAGVMSETAPAAAGSVVVVGYGSGDLMGLSADTGEELWSVSLASIGGGQATGGFSGFSGSPVIANDIAYAGSNNGLLAAVDTRDGSRLWDQSLAIRGTPYVAGEYVFVVSTRDVLYALRKADGKVRWSLQLPIYADEKRALNPFLWQGPTLAGGRLWLISPRGRILGVNAEKGEIAVDREAPRKVRHAPVIALSKMWLMDADATLHTMK